MDPTSIYGPLVTRTLRDWGGQTLMGRGGAAHAERAADPDPRSVAALIKQGWLRRNECDLQFTTKPLNTPSPAQGQEKKV